MTNNKSDRLHVLVTPEQKRQFQDAASAEALSLSAWIVRVLNLASKKYRGTKSGT
jgi:predicted HicB family RNase H-like nuclease